MKEMKKLDRRGVSPDKASSTKRSRSKAGVSPVIATILLILIAIAAGVIIYTYTIGFLGTAGPGTGQGEMVIDIASYTVTNPGDDAGLVYVRNVGGVPIIIASVYVTHVASGVVDADIAPGCTAALDTIGPGESTDCTFATDPGPPADSVDAADDVLIKVVAEDGTTASITVRAG